MSYRLTSFAPLRIALCGMLCGIVFAPFGCRSIKIGDPDVPGSEDQIGGAGVGGTSNARLAECTFSVSMTDGSAAPLQLESTGPIDLTLHADVVLDIDSGVAGSGSGMEPPDDALLLWRIDGISVTEFLDAHAKQAFPILQPGVHSVSLSLDLGNEIINCIAARNGASTLQVIALPRLSGTVVDATGAPLSGVSVTISGGSDADQTVQTDILGEFNAFVPLGWTGTVTPSHVGFQFSPPTWFLSGVNTNRAQDFSASPGSSSTDPGGGGGGTTPPPPPGGCIPADCDDNDPCTVDTCVSGSCSNTPAADGSPCDDGVSDPECGATCQGGACDAAAPVSAGAQCTDATTGDCDDAQCDGLGGCDQTAAFESTGKACGDPTQDACTNPDTCDAGGVCQPNDLPGCASCGASLITNPGFENGTGPWVKIGLTDRSLTTTDAHTGTRSLLMIASPQFDREVDQVIPVTAGRRYDASAWARVDQLSSANAEVRLVWVNSNGTAFATDVLDSLTGTQTWNRLSGFAVAPTGAVNVTLRLRLDVESDGVGSAYFDDAELCEAPSCAVNADCDDAVACNGVETCTGGACAPGANQCGAGTQCDTVNDRCVVCLSNADCDNSLYCDGAETCDANGDCVSGSNPCTNPLTPTCSETTDTCVGCLIDADCSGGEKCVVELGQTVCRAGLAINGTVTYYDGSLAGGVNVVLTGTGASAGTDFTVTTVGTGLYALIVPNGWSGTAASDGGHRFQPVSITFTNVTADKPGNDFVALRDFYVDRPNDGVGLSGSDSNPGTITQPFATIQYAVNSTQPGDRVIVRAGVYSTGSTNQSTFLLDMGSGQSGTAAFPITIKGADGESVVIDGQANGSDTRELVKVSASYVTFEGFEIRNALRSAIVVNAPSDHVTIRRCHAHHNNRDVNFIGGAIKSNGPVTYLVIEDCVASNNSIGIELRESPTQTTGSAAIPPIAGNTGFASDLPESQWDAWPGWTQYGPRYCTVRRCAVFDNQLLAEHSDGLVLRYAIDSVVEDCVIFRNNDDGLDGLATTRCIFRRNIAFNMNPNGNALGDGNGIKIGVRGGLDNIVHHNISFDNPRGGIDVADTERATVYNNTVVNNSTWFGIWYEATRALVGGMNALNNIMLNNGVGAGRTDAGAAGGVRFVSYDFNSHSDGANGNWSPAVGLNGFINTDPLFVNVPAVIDTNVPAGGTVFDLRDHIANQVYARFTLSGASPLIDQGMVIPGYTDGHLGAAPDLGAVESQ